MPEKPQVESPTLDEQIAIFSDQLVSDKPTEDLVLAPPNSELRNLQETILILHKVEVSSQPSQAVYKRIDQNLKRAWNIEFVSGSKRRSSFRNRRLLTLSVASLIVFLILVAIPLSYSGSVPLTGTAGIDFSLLPIILLLFGGIAGLIWWLWRRE